MKLAIRNVKTGEVLDVLVGGLSGIKLYVALEDLCALMNEEHKAGTDHVRDFHDGVGQQYRVVDLDAS